VEKKVKITTSDRRRERKRIERRTEQNRVQER
jgi:hypothetical protein